MALIVALFFGGDALIIGVILSFFHVFLSSDRTDVREHMMETLITFLQKNFLPLGILIALMGISIAFPPTASVAIMTSTIGLGFIAAAFATSIVRNNRAAVTQPRVEQLIS
ncbi:hypothetical protein ACX80D_11595 [Arthrobacter sp. Sr24]